VYAYYFTETISEEFGIFLFRIDTFTIMIIFCYVYKAFHLFTIVFISKGILFFVEMISLLNSLRYVRIKPNRLYLPFYSFSF